MDPQRRVIETVLCSKKGDDFIASFQAQSEVIQLSLSKEEGKAADHSRAGASSYLPNQPTISPSPAVRATTGSPLPGQTKGQELVGQTIWGMQTGGSVKVVLIPGKNPALPPAARTPAFTSQYLLLQTLSSQVDNNWLLPIAILFSEDKGPRYNMTRRSYIQ
ncbi:unnamed protein product [Natator depressus]